MDDKQTFHYRPSLVVRMCKSLRKIFSISSRAEWCFGPGKFTQSEPCCHFANMSADCALHHHFARPRVSCQTGERFLPPDALWGLRFYFLTEDTYLFAALPLLWFLPEQRTVQRCWWRVGWPWGTSVLLPGLAHRITRVLEPHASSSQQFQTSHQLYPKISWSSTVPGPLIYCWSTCVLGVNGLVWTNTASPRWGVGQTGTAMKAILMFHLAYNKKTRRWES